MIALASATGESVDVAIEKAAEARLRLLSTDEQTPPPVDMEKVYALLREIDAIPTIDHRTPDEILGYDENGLPTSGPRHLPPSSPLGSTSLSGIPFYPSRD